MRSINCASSRSSPVTRKKCKSTYYKVGFSGVQGVKPPDGVRGVPDKRFFLFLAAAGGEKEE